jgi:hypothetical protein
MRQRQVFEASLTFKAAAVWWRLKGFVLGTVVLAALGMLLALAGRR